MNRRVGWRPLSALAVAAACIVAGLLLPAPADAAHAGLVQVQLAGEPFTATPSGSLFRISGLAPGQSSSAVLGVRSGMDGGSALWLRLVDVHDDDNGCTTVEAQVDSGCGAGQGELGAALRFSVAVADSRNGPFVPAWAGSATQLAAQARTDVTLPPSGTRWLRLTAALPAGTGNAVQSDTFGFGLRVELQATSGVAGVSIGPRTGGAASSATASSTGGGSLAYTGASIALLTVGGVLLLLAGLLIARGNRSSARSG